MYKLMWWERPLRYAERPMLVAQTYAHFGVLEMFIYTVLKLSSSGVRQVKPL